MLDIEETLRLVLPIGVIAHQPPELCMQPGVRKTFSSISKVLTLM
jgi:hypothetical protein